MVTWASVDGESSSSTSTSHLDPRYRLNLAYSRAQRAVGWHHECGNGRTRSFGDYPHGTRDMRRNRSSVNPPRPITQRPTIRAATKPSQPSSISRPPVHSAFTSSSSKATTKRSARPQYIVESLAGRPPRSAWGPPFALAREAAHAPQHEAESIADSAFSLGSETPSFSHKTFKVVQRRTQKPLAQKMSRFDVQQYRRGPPKRLSESDIQYWRSAQKSRREPNGTTLRLMHQLHPGTSARQQAANHDNVAETPRFDVSPRDTRGASLPSRDSSIDIAADAPTSPLSAGTLARAATFPTCRDTTPPTPTIATAPTATPANNDATSPLSAATLAHAATFPTSRISTPPTITITTVPTATRTTNDASSPLSAATLAHAATFPTSRISTPHSITIATVPIATRTSNDATSPLSAATLAHAATFPTSRISTPPTITIASVPTATRTSNDATLPMSAATLAHAATFPTSRISTPPTITIATVPTATRTSNDATLPLSAATLAHAATFPTSRISTPPTITIATVPTAMRTSNDATSPLSAATLAHAATFPTSRISTPHTVTIATVPTATRTSNDTILPIDLLANSADAVHATNTGKSPRVSLPSYIDADTAPFMANITDLTATSSFVANITDTATSPCAVNTTDIATSPLAPSRSSHNFVLDTTDAATSPFATHHADAATSPHHFVFPMSTTNTATSPLAAASDLLLSQSTTTTNAATSFRVSATSSLLRRVVPTSVSRPISTSPRSDSCSITSLESRLASTIEPGRQLDSGDNPEITGPAAPDDISTSTAATAPCQPLPTADHIKETNKCDDVWHSSAPLGVEKQPLLHTAGALMEEVLMNAQGGHSTAPSVHSAVASSTNSLEPLVVQERIVLFPPSDVLGSSDWHDSPRAPLSVRQILVDSTPWSADESSPLHDLRHSVTTAVFEDANADAVRTCFILPEEEESEVMLEDVVSAQSTRRIPPLELDPSPVRRHESRTFGSIGAEEKDAGSLSAPPRDMLGNGSHEWHSPLGGDKSLAHLVQNGTLVAPRQSNVLTHERVTDAPSQECTPAETPAAVIPHAPLPHGPMDAGLELLARKCDYIFLREAWERWRLPDGKLFLPDPTCTSPAATAHATPPISSASTLHALSITLNRIYDCPAEGPVRIELRLCMGTQIRAFARSLSHYTTCGTSGSPLNDTLTMRFVGPVILPTLTALIYIDMRPPIVHTLLGIPFGPARISIDGIALDVYSAGITVAHPTVTRDELHMRPFGTTPLVPQISVAKEPDELLPDELLEAIFGPPRDNGGLAPRARHTWTPPCSPFLGVRSTRRQGTPPASRGRYVGSVAGDYYAGAREYYGGKVDRVVGKRGVAPDAAPRIWASPPV